MQKEDPAAADVDKRGVHEGKYTYGSQMGNRLVWIGGIVLKEICVLVFLGWNTWTDIRKKQVSLHAVWIFALAGIIAAAAQKDISWQYFLPVGVGCFFVAVSLVTRGAVGMGDGWLLMALGTVLKTEEFVGALLMGMLCCGVWSGILLFVFRKGRNTEIPFVPFLMLGYIGELLLWR